MKSIAHVGLDVHPDSIVAAILPESFDKLRDRLWLIALRRVIG